MGGNEADAGVSMGRAKDITMKVIPGSVANSLSAQVSHYSAFIQKHPGWRYAGVYADNAMTGTTVKRPEFQRLLADCRAGKIEILPAKWIQSHYSEHPPKPLEIRRFVTVA